MAKVLLVEDDNNLREIYEARLQAEGYQIVSANDGEAALVVAKSEKPDLIISDVMMPKISGFEMLDILRNTDELKATKVIMLTALGQAEDQSRADKLGADRYLVKSQVTLEDIVRVSHELLGDTPAPAEATAEPAAAAAAAAPVATPAAQPTPAIAVSQPPAEPAAAPVASITPPVVAAPAPASTAVAEPVPAAPAAAPAAPIVEPAAPIAPPTATPAAEPAPVAPPAMPAAPVAPAPTTGDAQTSAAEEATVEQQIDAFVAAQPTAPAAAPEPVPAAPAAVPVSAASAGDDQMLNAAVDNLVANAEPAAPVATEAAPVTPAAAPEAAPAPAPEAGQTEDENNESVPVARKKIIQPISDPTPKPDLTALLAAEEAKQSDGIVAAGNTVSPAAPGPASPAPGGSVPPTGGSGVDPNSIAL